MCQSARSVGSEAMTLLNPHLDFSDYPSAEARVPRVGPGQATEEV